MHELVDDAENDHPDRGTGARGANNKGKRPVWDQSRKPESKLALPTIDGPKSGSVSRTPSRGMILRGSASVDKYAKNVKNTDLWGINPTGRQAQFLKGRNVG